MDENKSPEDILEEIMRRGPASAPAPTPPPAFDPPPPDDIPLPPGKAPEKPAGPGWAVKLLPGLCAVLGAALLALCICVLQVSKVNDRLDGLQQALESVQANDTLQEEYDKIKALLQSALDESSQVKGENESLKEFAESVLAECNETAAQARQLNYLFYIGQFIGNGDEPMAALIAGLSADKYFSNLLYDMRGNEYDQAYILQYQSYRKELVDKGYLLESDAEESGYPSVTFAPQWDPEENPDMAALGLLWCVMEKYYVLGNPSAAVQFLVEYQYYPLRGTGTSCLEHLSHTAGSYASWQYELLLSLLKGQGYLVEEDGQFGYGTTGWSDDVLYSLPFEPPLDISAIRIGDH